MSSQPVVGFVCEGATDLPILQAVTDAVLGTEYVARSIQPDTDNLASLGGWTAVRSWCERNGTHLAQFLTFAGIDILVIQIDADVGKHLGVKTTSDICQTVKSWLGPGARDIRLVLVVPAQATDTWLLAAHAAVTPQIENEAHPARVLVTRKLLEADRSGRPIKDLATYRRHATRITDRLADMRKTLTELDRFANKLETVAQARLGRAPVNPRPSPAPKSRKARRRS